MSASRYALAEFTHALFALEQAEQTSGASILAVHDLVTKRSLPAPGEEGALEAQAARDVILVALERAAKVGDLAGARAEISRAAQQAALDG